MKIITGEYSGRNFYMPAGIRPTQNVLRKAVFDIIGHDLTGLSFLELFAGSGAMGLEALSLGASEVHFVEHDPKNAKVIEENLGLLRPADRGLVAYVHNRDAFATIKEFARQNKAFHVVFFDPTYGLKLARKALKTLWTHDILAPHSFLIVQCELTERLPEVDERYVVIKDKVYGGSRLVVYERQA